MGVWAHAAGVLRDHGAERRFGNAQLRNAFPVLVNALAFGEPALFAEHLHWLDAVAGARGDRYNDAQALLRHLRAEIAAIDEPGRAEALAFVAAAEALPPAPAQRALDTRDPALDFLERLLAYDQRGARRLAGMQIAKGAGLPHVYEELLEPALIETGRRWQAALLTVGQEHYLSDAVLRIANVLCESVPRAAHKDATFVGLCVEGERHDLGLRMIRNVLYADGWTTVFLGADVPGEEFASILRESKPAVVGISVTMTAHLDAARAAIVVVRRNDPAARVVVGGKPFRDGGDLWSRLGADAGQRGLGEAVAAIDRLGEQRFG
jgi:methanogenic corrinoid protein MtbC1